jgi:hypothetical protein
MPVLAGSSFRISRPRKRLGRSSRRAAFRALLLPSLRSLTIPASLQPARPPLLLALLRTPCTIFDLSYLHTMRLQLPGVTDKTPPGETTYSIANKHVAVIPQIESRLGIANLDAIMRNPQVDGVAIGGECAPPSLLPFPSIPSRFSTNQMLINPRQPATSASTWVSPSA